MGARGKIQIFSGRSAHKYSIDVQDNLQNLNEYTQAYVDLVGETLVRSFSNGEIEIEIHNSVRRKDIYILQNTSWRNEGNLSTHENKIELYHLIDAATRSQSSSITVFEPFISSSRSDRAFARNSVGIWIHFQTLIALGANHIITYQLHSDKSKSIVNPTLAHIDDVPLYPIIQKHLLLNYVKTKKNYSENIAQSWAFCTVDAGGEKIAKRFADMFSCQLIIANKRRNYSTIHSVDGITLLTDDPIEEKVVWIVDDMIDTAGSLIELLKVLKKQKPAQINVAIVHPVLSGPGVQRLKDLHNDNFLNKLVVCDTIWISDDIKKQLPFVEIIPTAPLTANIIYKTNIGESLSVYFDPFDPFEYLV